MTAEQLHDALTLLPADLIAEADKARCPKPKVLRWKPLAALAACFVLVLGSGWYLAEMGLMNMNSTTKLAAPEAPAAAAPMLQEPADAAPMEAVRQESALEEAEENSLCGVPTAEAEHSTGASAGGALCIDHAHHPAEAHEGSQNTVGWCGNMTATVFLDEATYTLSGSYAVTLTDILYHLDYTPESLCRCAAEFTVDTEMGTSYAINLSQYFVRFEGGQAALTEEQADQLRQIINGLGELP